MSATAEAAAGAATPSPVLFEVKLREFRPAGDILHRPRLTGALAESPATLVLVAAPPGFGKTTLLGEWCQADSRPFACLSVDAADNDPAAFWGYVIAALRRVEPRFVAPTPGDRGDITGTVVPAVLRNLQSLDTQLVLAIDDYHMIENPRCHDALSYFLQRMPGNVTLALSTRADPPISLGRLRASGGLLEVRAAGLSFTEREEAQFLNETMGFDVSPQAVAVLHRRTEGWPVGVRLASLSIGRVSDNADFVEHFGGSNRHVADYLVEVVLDTLVPELRRFLLETSILESMCGSLCDAVTRTQGSTEVLAEVERANLFLIPLDDRREWYRYHQLFADVLRNQLLRGEPGLQRELHARAGSWFAAQGRTDEAIHHALAGGEVETAARLISERRPHLIELGQGGTVLRWLDAFPAGAVETDPRLSLARAWAMSAAGRRDEALDALAAAESGEIALFRACFPWGDVTRMLAGACRAHELRGTGRSAWRPAVHLALGRARYFTGEHREAVVLLEEAARLAVRAKRWLLASTSKGVLARTLLAMGYEARAESTAREAVDLAESHDVGGQPGAGWAYLALGAVRARMGQIDEAEPLLSTGLTRFRTEGEELYIAETLLCLAPVRRAQGARDEARALLAEARDVIERCSQSGILRQRLAEVARTMTPAHRRIDGDSELTEREREVLQHLAQGLPKRQIGNELFLSFNTIHSHTKSIYRKLRVSSREAAVERARELGAI